MQERWERVVGGHCGGAWAHAARAGLSLAAGLYRLGLEVNLHIYTTGLKRPTRPLVPVVSVGNLSLGGAGKTTAASFIAQHLRRRHKTGIVLRGYRRQSTTEPLVVSTGSTVCAGLDEAGDEALMLARLLPECAVGVGKRRERVIEALVQQAGVGVVVLDDGFQYFRMARSLDIVLLDALADGATWRLFPAGRLREPPQHLDRAHQVWITHADLSSVQRVRELRALAQRHCPRGLIALTRHRVNTLRPLVEGVAVPQDLAGRVILALSALGNPEAFEGALRVLGAKVTPVRYPDHHRYCPDDYRRVTARAAEVGAELIVTTEKDAVKLPPAPAGCPPVAVAGCELEIIEGQDAVMASIDEVLDAL